MSTKQKSLLKQKALYVFLDYVLNWSRDKLLSYLFRREL